MSIATNNNINHSWNIPILLQSIYYVKGDESITTTNKSREIFGYYKKQFRDADWIKFKTYYCNLFKSSSKLKIIAPPKTTETKETTDNDDDLKDKKTYTADVMFELKWFVGFLIKLYGESPTSMTKKQLLATYEKFVNDNGVFKLDAELLDDLYTMVIQQRIVMTVKSSDKVVGVNPEAVLNSANFLMNTDLSNIFTSLRQPVCGIKTGVTLLMNTEYLRMNIHFLDHRVVLNKLDGELRCEVYYRTSKWIFTKHTFSVDIESKGLYYIKIRLYDNDGSAKTYCSEKIHLMFDPMDYQRLENSKKLV